MRTETLIVADEDDASLAASPAGRAAATQTTTTADTTLSFPSDFAEPVLHNDSPFTAEYDFDYHLPHASITQTVIDRGGIIPWASIDGGNSWHAGGFDLGGAIKLRFVYRASDSEDEPDAAGSVTITLAAIGIARGAQTYDITAATARANLRRYLKTNPLLIRFFIITDQE